MACCHETADWLTPHPVIREECLGGGSHERLSGKRVAQNTQLYQIIQIDGNELTYRAYEATGQLYDEFKLQKRKGAANLLIESESLPAENRG